MCLNDIQISAFHLKSNVRLYNRLLIQNVLIQDFYSDVPSTLNGAALTLCHQYADMDELGLFAASFQFRYSVLPLMAPELHFGIQWLKKRPLSLVKNFTPL